MSQVNEKPSYDTAPAGSIRFNTDSAKMEIYNGAAWWNIDSTSPTEQTGGTRGLIMGGIISGRSNQVEFANLETTGDFADFGDLVQTASQGAGMGSRTRAIACGGTPSSPGGTNNIDFATIASTGNFADFGDMVAVGFSRVAVANQTRGVVLGNAVAPLALNNIEHLTIASTGSANDFGDCTIGRQEAGAAGNATRAIVLGGSYPDASIDYVTISTTGNAADFGDCSTVIWNTRGGNCGNAIRGLIAGGGASLPTNIIQYVTITTLGDTVDFGDRLVAKGQTGHMSSTIRGVFAGAGEKDTNVVDYVNIMTTGDAVDFGDLSANGSSGYGWAAGASNGHGGLG